jgi:hypothetical protein
MHEWREVEADLFPHSDESRVAEIEEALRARIRAHAATNRGALLARLCARLRRL